MVHSQCGNMEDEPATLTLRSLVASCKHGHVFWSFLSISTIILVALGLFTFHQVFQGKEFTMKEIVYTSAVFAVCLVTIATAIICRLYGLKMDNKSRNGYSKQTSTEGMTQILIGPVVDPSHIPRSVDTVV